MRFKGLILINAYSGEKSLAQSVRLRDELSKLNIQTEIKHNNFIAAHIEGGQILQNLGVDFCVYFDKDKYISHMLEKSGIRLFNKHSAIRACDDKMTTHILLSQNQINMPATIAAPLCYDNNAKVDAEFALKLADKLGFPMVVKKCYGSLGSGVFLAENESKLLEIMQGLMFEPHLFQKYIGAKRGEDLRVIVIGGKAAAAMRRVNTLDFRSNLELGGKGYKTKLPKQAREIAQKAAEILQLDYCGVDTLFDGENYLLCEVNSNAYFSGIEKVTGANIAKLYAQHIQKELIIEQS